MTITSSETVSVIVRAFNAEKYIKKALASILNNTYKGPIEVVICHDTGSKDRTLEKIEESIPENQYRENRTMKFISHVHTTPFHALLDCGFMNATGRFVSILDYDNLYPREHIEKMVDTAIKTRKDFLFVRDYFFDDRSLRITGSTPLPQNPYDITQLIKRNYIDGNAMFIDRPCLSIIMDRLRRLNHRFYDLIYEDWLIALLGLKHCKCFFSDNSYVFYRVHSLNLTGVGVKDYRTSVLSRIRDISTLIAFYELEKENLTRKEIRAIENSLIIRFLVLAKSLSDGMVNAPLFELYSRIAGIIYR
jgi:glycosyltransferase involved in cell wall biosynthesis